MARGRLSTACAWTMDLHSLKPLRTDGTPHFFIETLFKTELVKDLELESAVLADLPQVGESSDSLLSADVTLDELHEPG